MINCAHFGILEVFLVWHTLFLFTMAFRRARLINPLLDHSLTDIILVRFRHRQANEVERSARMLKRLLGEYEKSKSRVFHPTSVVVAQTGPKFLTSHVGHEKSISRRQVVLNKHFMECISDVLLTEKIGDEIREHGIRITL